MALGGPAEAAKLINGKNIRKGTVRSKQIKNRSLQTYDLSRSAVASLMRTPVNSIGSTQIIGGAVTGEKLAAASVNSATVADESLGAIDLAPDSVGRSEVADRAIGGFEIANNAVSGNELVDGGMNARDIGAFNGSFTFDFGSLAAGTCLSTEQDVLPIRAVDPLPVVTDDVVVVGTPAGWPAGLTLTAAPAAATKIAVHVCNVTDAVEPIDPPSLVYRYLTFDSPA